MKVNVFPPLPTYLNKYFRQYYSPKGSEPSETITTLTLREGHVLISIFCLFQTRLTK